MVIGKLKEIGFETTEDEHDADFYYILKVKVEDDHYPEEELKVSEVNSKNGNDTFSPHSPKILYVYELICIGRCAYKRAGTVSGSVTGKGKI